MKMLFFREKLKIYYQIFPRILFIILMSTNGQQLNSEAIARYLTTIAANERKLEYCREILSANPTFVPPSYFQQAESGAKGQISRQSFRKLLENHNESHHGQQADLIYSYFCIDEKGYVTFDQFYAAITPKNNPSISKIIKKRQKDSYSMDYSLQFALCKFYSQVYETQYQLQMRRMFSINIDSTNYRLKDGLKLALNDLEQFLADHSKFPTEPILKLLHGQINVNKGRGKRNLSIRIYIKKYLERKRFQKGQLPPIQIIILQKMQREPVHLRPIKEVTNLTYRSQQKEIIKPPNKKSNKKQNTLIGQSQFCFTPQVTLKNVENRIHSLLSIVEVKSNIPEIRWGNYPSKKPQQIITPLEQISQIQNIQSKDNELTTKPKQSLQTQIPIFESLRYSSMKIGQSQKKRESVQENHDGNQDCLAERENSFSERQKLRKRFKLTQQSIYTPCRRLSDCSTPIVHKNIQAERPHQGKQAKEVLSAEKTPQRKVFNYSQQKEAFGDQSRYKKYSYLNKSRNSLANRISYLKQLVSSPTQGTPQR